MSEQKHSVRKKSWAGWQSAVIWFLLLVVVFFLAICGLLLSANPAMRFPGLIGSSVIFAVCASLAAMGVIFLIRWLRHWRNVKRFLFVAACFATLVAMFYAEENWRGKRAWEKCKRDLEAKGEVLDWNKLIPPSVPDEQNMFKAPNMTERFVKPDWRTPKASQTNALPLSRRLSNPKTSPVTAADRIKTEAEAREYLDWSDQFTEEFNLVREALKRPYARMDGDYSQPPGIPIPNFVAFRTVAQILAQRARCHLLLRQPEQALAELTLVHDLTRMLDGAPTGGPMILVTAMINVAIRNLYLDTFAQGLQLRVWQESQLARFQRQLEEINLLPLGAQGLREGERTGTIHTLEKAAPAVLADQLITMSGAKPNFFRRFQDPIYVFLTFAPRGWVYQNMVVHANLLQRGINSFDLDRGVVIPRETDEFTREISSLSKWSPHSFLEWVILPNFGRAVQILAYTQSKADQAQIACGLERIRLAHQELPESLDALVPQFIGKLPDDIIGGQPLHYRRTTDGKFILYSVGWNETDDRGQAGVTKRGQPDYTSGDWVWQMPDK